MKRGIIILFLVTLFYVSLAKAAPVYDYNVGTWSYNFNDTSGLSSRVNMSVFNGSLQLLNRTSGFSPPYNLSGYAITTSISPLMVAQWTNITFNSSTPQNTSIRIQVLDGNNNLYPDSVVPGNTAGFSNSPINLSMLSVDLFAIPCNDSQLIKIPTIKIKIIMNTTNSSFTPTISNLTLSFIVRRGDLSHSTMANTSWPAWALSGTSTKAISINSSSIYPSIKWVKSIGVDNDGRVIRGFGDLIYYKTMGGLPTASEGVESKLFAINRTNGATIWSKNISGYGFVTRGFTLSQNGILYSADMYNDILIAWNATDGSVNWLYNWYATHGNDYVSIGSDGMLYTIRGNGFCTVYAFYPNGTVKWNSTFSYSGAGVCSETPTIIGNNETLYFATTAYDNSNDYNNVYKGQIYALNSTNGSIIWNYTTGDSTVQPIIDDSGIIYVLSNGFGSRNNQVYAFYSNGTVKWNISVSNSSVFDMQTLRQDGILLVSRLLDSANWLNDSIDAINTTNGNVLWNLNTSLRLDNLFSNNLNGFYLSTILQYYDSNANKKWQFYYPNYDMTAQWDWPYVNPSIDEDGNIYVNYFSSFAWNSEYYYGGNMSLLKVSPWTLTSTSNSAEYNPGNTITFTATTSMQSINLLTREENKMQVVLDNGDKVNLIYSYNTNDTSNNTVWNGTYILPSSTSTGSHTYTVEASAASIWTDINTSFASPANNTNNTGINTTGSFSVAAVSAPVSEVSGGGFGIKEYLTNEQQLNAGYKALLSVNDKIKFEIKNENHTLKVSSLSNNKITIIISSSPIIATLDINETREFDLNNDSINEISVKVEGIKNGKAKILIKQIDNSFQSSQKLNQTNSDNEIKSKEFFPNNEKNKIFYLIISLIVLVIIVMVIVFLKIRKKKY